MRRLLALDDAPGAWRFLGASVGEEVVGRYQNGAALAVVTLRHPDRRAGAALLTARFAVSVRSSAPPAQTAALAAAVLASLRAHEGPFGWVDAAVRPKEAGPAAGDGA